VYGTTTGFNPDQLSAMPSVHVGWAVLVAILIISATRSRWRWLAVAYPAATSLIVVVTANHFWADGIVAAFLLVLVLLVQHLVTKLRPEISQYRPIPEKVDVASSR
ncbi:MAG: phosphatase PAP2 family protein, partial [Actinomycetota bacterium]